MVPGKFTLQRLLAALAAGLALAGCAAAPPPAEAPQPTGNAADARVISIFWEGDAAVDRSSIDFLGRTPSGERFRAAVSRADETCDIRYSLQWHKVGSWALWCDSGRTASGAFRTLGGGKGSFGWGEDDRGRQVAICGARQQRHHRGRSPGLADRSTARVALTCRAAPTTPIPCDTNGDCDAA